MPLSRPRLAAVAWLLLCVCERTRVAPKYERGVCVVRCSGGTGGGRLSRLSEPEKKKKERRVAVMDDREGGS